MSRRLFYTLLLLAVVLAAAAASAAHPEVPLSDQLARGIDPSKIKAHVKHLSSLKSRCVGYPGYYEAVSYVAKELASYGLRVWNQSFTAPVPVEEGASLVVYNGSGAVEIEVHMAYPNYLVVPERVEGLEGELIYVGRGFLKDFDGKDVEGKIVVMDAASGSNWLNAMSLGAKAVIFVNVAGVFDRLEALTKLAMVPVRFPRFFVADRASSVQLIRLALKGCRARLSGSIELRPVRAYNVIAELEGEDPNLVVVLGAHVDSISVTPAVAPGAEDSIGVAILLELARLLSRVKPRYTVWFVAFSSHWQGLLGPRMFLEENFMKGGERKLLLTVCFDISSGDSKVVPSIGGFFYAHKHINVLTRHSQLVSKLRAILREFEAKYPADYTSMVSQEYKEGIIFNADYPFKGFAIPFIMDAEPMTLAGTIGFTLVTFKDYRVRFFTPYDTYESVDWGNVIPQARFCAFVAGSLLSSPVSEITSSVVSPTRIEIMPQGGFGFAVAEIEVVRYDPRVPTLYSPVPNSIVSIYKVSGWYARYEAYNQYNIFARIITFADERGRAVVHGVPVSAAAAGRLYVEAFKFDEETGALIYAPDDGPNGAGRFPHIVEVKYPYTRARTVVFKCSEVVMTDVILPDKPHSLITLNSKCSPVTPIPNIEYECPMPVTVKVLRAVSFVEPESYGSAYDPLSGVVVAFIPPGERIQLIVSLTGLQRKTMLILNSTEENPRGEGLISREAGEQMVMPFAILEYVEALYWLAKERYERVAAYGVIDPVLERYMTSARDELAEAVKHLEGREYSKAHSLLMKAWSSSLKAYERSKSINMDATNSTIPLLVLVIPFAILLEALVLSLKGYRKVTAMILLAFATFMVIRAVHPGFQIAISLPALVIGVILIVMLAPTIFFLVTELSYSIAEVRKRVFGLHFLERERVGLMLSAISVGIQNMRKRPLRSILTSIAVILLVALLIALTSLLPLVVVKPMAYSIPVEMTGIVVRAPHYEPLSVRFVEELRRLYPDWKVGERYWAYTWDEIVYSPNGANVTIKAVVAFSAAERELIFRNVAIYGGWFSERDKYACILPSTIAEALNVTLGSEVYLLGLRLVVIGICEQTSLEGAIDIDALSPVPLDTEALQTSRAFDERLRLTWADVILVPAELARATPGFFLTSVALYKGNATEDEIMSVASDIFEHFDNLAVYACYKGKAVLFSRAYSYTVFGMEFMVVPLVLVSLILITTLLGGMHERLREASIYSALGLTPTLVAFMFLTEGIIYAVLGEVLGYVVGAVMASTIRLQGAGLIGINYSSSSIAMTMGITLAVIVASSGYPFIKIASLVTPSLERKWKPKTKPKGDVWEIPLPYVFTSDREVVGLLSYLVEFMEARKIERAGTFSVVDVGVRAEEEAYFIESVVRLAPFELNIVQDATLTFLRSKTEQRIYTILRVRRRSGPYSSWLTSNLRFMDEIRKQLLTWRLLKPEEQDKYVAKGTKLVGELAHG